MALIKWKNFLLLFVFVTLCQENASFSDIGLNKNVVLYCGFIKPGCEDVHTDTLEIKLFKNRSVQIIRKYHGSDLPITSAFSGSYRDPKKIVVKYDLELTSKNLRQEQPIIPHGSVSISLKCGNYKNLKNCTVSGKPVNGSIISFPGWIISGFKNNPQNLKCNSKKFNYMKQPTCD